MDFQNRGQQGKKEKKKKNISLRHVYIYIIETHKERKERSVAYEMLDINV